MTRDDSRKPKFGTMLVEPPQRKHSGTMVLETPKIEPRPSSPPPFEPTEILGADYGHLSMPEEETSIAVGEPSGPALPFTASRPRPRSGGIYGTSELTIAAVPERAPRPPTRLEPPNPAPVFGPPPVRPSAPPPRHDSAAPQPPVAPPPRAPAYLGPIQPSEPRAAAPSASPFRNEPIGETRGVAAARPSPPPPRGEARNEGNARLAALLHGPWLFPNEDD